MKEFAFTVIIEPDSDSYHAYVPALKGCYTFGDTLGEAQNNIVEAMQLHLESMLEDGVVGQSRLAPYEGLSGMPA